MSESSDDVPDDIVAAALRVAERTGLDAADVPVLAVAAEAGISRSTLIRRLGGSRSALDDAIRAAGVDPGGRVPVRDRAVRAAAEVISEHGLRAATLEAVAVRAQCSVHSIYAAFGGRDALLQAVFDRYAPLPDLTALTVDAGSDLGTTVRKIYQVITEALSAEPRVVPAMLADAIGNPPAGGANSMFAHAFPQLLAALGPWLASEVAAGRIRGLPLPLLFQQMIAPVAMHTMLRPAVESVASIALPPLPDCAEMFAEAFIKAVGAEPFTASEET